MFDSPYQQEEVLPTEFLLFGYRQSTGRQVGRGEREREDHKIRFSAYVRTRMSSVRLDHS